MAASQDHAIMPAHAHLNLLGWVSLFLFGIFYERRPTLDRGRLAMIQVWVWSFGTVFMTIGVAAIHLGYVEFEPVAGIGALTVLGGMLLFAYLVFRPGDSLSATAAGISPAE